MIEELISGVVEQILPLETKCKLYMEYASKENSLSMKLFYDGEEIHLEDENESIVFALRLQKGFSKSIESSKGDDQFRSGINVAID